MGLVTMSTATGIIVDSCPAHLEHLSEPVGEKNPIPQEIHF